jgi:tetratricopeptide (TPR) repeat protein
MLYTALAELFLFSGRCTEELGAAERAAQVARLVGDDRSLARAEYLRGQALSLVGRVEEALIVTETAIRLAEGVRDYGCLAEAFGWVALIYEERGEFEQCKRYAERALVAAQQLGAPAIIADMTIRLGASAFFNGDWAQARHSYEQVQTIHRQIGIAPTSCAYADLLLNLGRLRLAEGDWEAASRYLEESRTIFEPQAKRMGLRAVQSLLAERDVLAGQPEAARARLLPLLDRWGVEEWIVTTHVLPALAWTCLEQGDTNQGAKLVAHAIRRARAQTYRLGLVEALRVQAMLALRQGHRDEAECALEEGLALTRSMPYPRGEGRLLQVSGELHVQQGELEAARERLEAALAIFGRLGARKDAERAQQAIADLLQP